MYWDSFDKEGWNPAKEEKVVAKRREIKVDLEIPTSDEYNQFILDILKKEMLM